MQFKPSTTSFALLGLLRLRSWSTYELTQQVQRSLHWFWPLAERKLYYEPKLLAAAGLATATIEATGNRPRTVYAITDQGRAQLATWLSEPAEPRTAEFAAMVKVFFADAGSLDQLLNTIEEIETEARTRLASLKTMARESLDHFPFPGRQHLSALSMRLQLAQEQAILDWATWARAQTQLWTSPADPGPWDVAAALRQMLGEAPTP